MKKWQSESILDLYNLLLAIVLFASSWLFIRGSGNATVQDDLWATSLAIAMISLASIVAYANWEEWANLLLGIWLIVSPWALGFAHTRAMHFSIGVGAAVAFLAALELWLRFEAASRESSLPEMSQKH